MRDKIAFTVRLLALMVAFCAVGRVWAAKEIVNGITWTYAVVNGTASVSSGASFTSAIPNTTTGHITIPSTLGGCKVTSIGNYAFDGCSELTSVTIGGSVTLGGNTPHLGDCVVSFLIRTCPSYYKRDFMNLLFAEKAKV